MTYTFTGVDGDDITWALQTTIGATSRISLVTGWYYPTSLGGGRTFWSAGNVIGMWSESGDTTDLRMYTDNTTDSLYTTTTGDIVINEWRFIAWLMSCNNTGPAVAHRCWIGRPEQAPLEFAVSQTTAPVGNFSGTTNFYVGNAGTGSFSFGGDITDVSVMVSDAAVGVTTHPFGVAAYGAITNEEALHLYETLVVPLWLGDTSVMFSRPCNHTLTLNRYHWSGEVGAMVEWNVTTSATLGPTAATVSGAVISQNGSPRPTHMPAMLPMPRR